MLDWLDAGLRRGERSLAPEYPLSFGEDTRAVQRVVFAEGAPVAHALLQSVEVLARERALRIGLIGSVYSDPAWRGRGLAQACVNACVHEARAHGLALVLLWSELTDFYGRLGFVPAGRDRLLTLDETVLARVGEAEPREVGLAAPAELAVLDALYACKPVHVHRPAGALARFSGAPGTALVVARRAGLPVAYAALGRGDDFQGVIHEWAGESGGVLACCAELVRRCGPLRILAGPEPEAPIPRLLAAGASCETRPLGLVRLLDARELWCAIAPRNLGVRFAQQGEHVELAAGSARRVLSVPAALELFFGSGVRGLAGALASPLHSALAAALPWPLYVWGFDSV